jgi:hypothetical protein
MLSIILAVGLSAQHAPASSVWEQREMSSSPTHQMMLPPTLDVANGKVDVFLMLKGSPARVAEALKANGRSIPAIVVTDPGFSVVYREAFADPMALQRMLDELTTAIRAREDVADDVELDRVYVASFSAGYAAVRELLKHPQWFERIAGALFLDSIYAGFSDAGPRHVEPMHMSDFNRFADEAAAGRRNMIVTHTKITPESYASTWETADELMKHLGIASAPVNPPREIGEGLKVDREAHASRFHLFGTLGDNADEHGRHLRNLPEWMPLLFAAPTP